MSATRVPLPTIRRELGRVDQGEPGPTLLLQGGIHGNEPAGVVAIQRVLARLQELGTRVAGRVVALAGNLPALELGNRYVVRDLNRQWLPGSLERLHRADPADDKPEDREQRELLRCYESVVASASGPVVFLDLHTSSADGPPFVVLADTIDNRRIGVALGVPILLGLEELIDGACMEWFSSRGIVNCAIEGGRHQHQDTVGNLESAVWLALEAIGILRKGAVDLGPHRAHLTRVTKGLPPVVEIFHRHAIVPEDRFRMEPGFLNFSPVVRGQLLAQERGNEVRATSSARVLLPLYQAQGDDGFFLGRPVTPLWTWLARVLRGLHLSRIVRWFPGVRRDPEDPATLVVDPRIARWFMLEVFHLLGYRRQGRRGASMTFTKRRSREENALLGPQR